MPSLENIRAARAATDWASVEFRALCVAALADHPLRQVAIAANVSRDTLYAWKLQASQNARPTAPTALHHINGNPYDNRPENLQIADVEAHTRPATPTDTEETQP